MAEAGKDQNYEGLVLQTNYETNLPLLTMSQFFSPKQENELPIATDMEILMPLHTMLVRPHVERVPTPGM